MHHHQVRIYVRDRRADRRALALVLRVLQENPFKILASPGWSKFPPEPLERRCRAILAKHRSPQSRGPG